MTSVDSSNARSFASQIEPVRAELQGLIDGVRDRAESADHRPAPGSIAPEDQSGFGLGRMMQSYLSLFVHSATMGLLTTADMSQAKKRGDYDGAVPLMSSSDSVGQMLCLALHAYVESSGNMLTYFGWADSDWQRQVINSFQIATRYFPS